MNKIDRFFSFVERVPEAGCWIWTGKCGGSFIPLAPPDRTPDARSTMAAQPVADEPSIEVDDIVAWMKWPAGAAAEALAALNRARGVTWQQMNEPMTDFVTSPAAPVAQADARSTSDAAVVFPHVPFPAQFDRLRRGNANFNESEVRSLMREHERNVRASIADRATRSTDSSAEAAGMERAAKWVDDRADAYDRDHGQSDPDTSTRWWPGDGEDYMFELDEIATGIRAEAAKLTTAPHTADETRVDGEAK